MSPIPSVRDYLGEAHVPYTVLSHRPAYTAQEEAAATHVPGRDWAKVVVCLADGQPVLAVLPAPRRVDVDRLNELAGSKALRLAYEDEFRGLFPGCEVGAMPPFGPLYGQRVFVDESLTHEPEIVFNAGTHSEAIRMRYADFAAVARPIVGRFAR